MGKSITDPRLFDHDPLTGMTTYFISDDKGEGFTLHYQQDVEPLIEQNTALANDAPTRFGELTRVASFPAFIVMQLAQQGIMTTGGTILDEKRFSKWLNDRDNRVWRTRTGRV